jgi:hypothetical protein
MTKMWHVFGLSRDPNIHILTVIVKIYKTITFFVINHFKIYVAVFLDLTPWNWGSTDLWNVGILPKHYTLSQVRKPRFSLRLFHISITHICKIYYITFSTLKPRTRKYSHPLDIPIKIVHTFHVLTIFHLSLINLKPFSVLAQSTSPRHTIFTIIFAYHMFRIVGFGTSNLQPVSP